MDAIDGYDKLAVLMAQHKDMAIFRKFSTLGVKNLLYRQAELVHLEAQLQQAMLDDRTSKDAEKEAYQYSVFNLLHSSDNSDKGRQWRKALEVREKLEEYYGVLLQFAEVTKLEQANKTDLNFLRNWLDRADGGHLFLRGREASTWEDRNTSDLVGLSPRYSDKDHLTRWMGDKLIPWFHEKIGYRIKKPISGDKENGLWEYKEQSFVTVAHAISTTLASLLPTFSIFILYFMSNPLARLGGIIAFTTLFAVTLALITKARRVDTFAATTAFAAVQVVFVGNTNNCSVCPG